MTRTYLGMSALLGITIFSLTAGAATVATVNGKVITDEDLSAAVANLPQYQKDITIKDPNARRQLIQDLVDQELMVQEATAKKVDNTKEFKEAFNTMRKQALVNALVLKQLAPQVNEAGVKAYYNKNKGRYSTDEVHAQHILLGSQKEAEQVLAEVKKPGVDFQKVAESRSKDPSAKNTRGDVGFFSRTMFDQAFTDAAFGANAGDIVGPVKTAFGWHVIKVVDRKVGKTLEFSEVEQRVRADYQRELLKNYVLNLRKNAKIKE
jgi:peptidyl-prolyl cis-trans isomerase C